MTVGPDKVALFVRCHRDELTRIWRMARSTARAETFPGLIDGVVDSFLDSCSELLDGGAEPEEVWTEIAGVVRCPPALVPDELHREWALLAEVIAAACDCAECDETAREWLRRATAHCRSAMAALVEDGEEPPPALVTAVVYSAMAPRRVRPEHGTNA